MTKADLLRFLEPFTDDIRIIVEEDMGLLDEPHPRYLVAPHKDEDGHTQADLAERGISAGEGYVLL